MKFMLVAALAGSTIAYPGMKGTASHGGLFKDIMVRAAERTGEHRALGKRQAPPAQPVELIGDLQTSGGTETNQKIMTCLNDGRGLSCLEAPNAYIAPLKGSPACAADTCCIWSYIQEELIPIFKEADGTCGAPARAAVRFGFHDAGAWSKTSGHGGADGSLLLSDTEINRSENNGMQQYRLFLKGIYFRYKSFGISAADLVQFAHNVAVLVCPLGPRSLTFVGRPDFTQEAPTGLLPDANSPSDELIELFVNKTIHEVDLVALIGAHTTANQFFFDTTKAGMPLDSTPGVWDVAFYSEVLAGAPPAGVFRLPADNVLGNDSSTLGGFRAMSAPNGVGQALWNGLYAKAYLRLSLLGVQDIQGMTDCSHILINETTVFPPVSSSSSSSVASSTTSYVSSATDAAKTFSTWSHYANTTASWSASYGGGKGPKPTGSKGGDKSGKPTGSKGGDKSGKPTSSWGDEASPSKSSSPVYDGSWPAADPAITSKPAPGAPGWGYATQTVYSTKTYTITKCPPTVKNCPVGSTTTELVPVGWTVAPWDPQQTTATSYITHTVTLHGGKVTTSVEAVWPKATITASASKGPEKCVVKTVSVTTTVWA